MDGVILHTRSPKERIDCSSLGRNPIFLVVYNTLSCQLINHLILLPCGMRRKQNKNIVETLCSALVVWLGLHKMLLYNNPSYSRILIGSRL